MKRDSAAHSWMLSSNPDKGLFQCPEHKRGNDVVQTSSSGRIITLNMTLYISKIRKQCNHKNETTWNLLCCFERCEHSSGRSETICHWRSLSRRHVFSLKALWSYVSSLDLWDDTWKINLSLKDKVSYLLLPHWFEGEVPDVFFLINN